MTEIIESINDSKNLIILIIFFYGMFATILLIKQVKTNIELHTKLNNKNDE